MHHHAAVPMTGVFAKADIGNHQKFMGLLLDDSYSLLDNSIRTIARGADIILLFWNAKEDHGRDAKINNLLNFLWQ
ncbi:hypothetical protein ES703_36890 [subsurface metagenome]